MKSIENNLIDAVINGHEKKVILYYKKLISKYESSQKNRLSLRSLKNYLICINCMLYRLCIENKLLKDELFEKRNIFITEIDRKDNFESLYVLGKEIVLFYNTINNNYCYTCHPVVNQALDFIHNNLNKDLTLEIVAREIHISKNYLSNIFPLHVKSSFSYYVNKVKIDYSKRLLTNSSKSLIDIAFECGFNSQSYFCSIFKKIEGITPLRYKKQIFK